jgi:hypothetical protein
MRICFGDREDRQRGLPHQDQCPARQVELHRLLLPLLGAFHRLPLFFHRFMLEQEIPRSQEAETSYRGLFFQEMFVVRMKRDRVLPRSVVVDEGKVVRGVGTFRSGVQ